MRIIVIMLLLLVQVGCKNNDQKDTKLGEDSLTYENIREEDSLYFENERLREADFKSQLRKKEGLIESEDDTDDLKELVQSRQLFLESDTYLLDYTYPYLNESVNPGFKKFNEHMFRKHLNVERTINEILEDKEIICDTLSGPMFRDKRIIDFKLHSIEDNLISILLFKENYYSGMLHSTYTFESLNFNSVNHEFITYHDFFTDGSEEVIHYLINKRIYDQMEVGDMYYDCWGISEEDFERYKSNFVVDGDFVSFYFDDCVVCPSYTGEYKVSIPLTEILYLIKNNQQSILM